MEDDRKSRSHAVGAEACDGRIGSEGAAVVLLDNEVVGRRVGEGAELVATRP